MTPAGGGGGRTTGLVLAGGRATRMGGRDKGLVELADRPMAAHVVERLAPQVDHLLINANRNAEAYAALGPAVVGDTVAGFAGPLAGVLAGMRAAPGPWLATAPCDSPFVPAGLVERLRAGLDGRTERIAVAHDGDRLQPVFMLVATGLADALEHWLAAGGRKIDAWFGEQGCVAVDFSDHPDTFLNINTDEERRAIEARLLAGD